MTLQHVDTAIAFAVIMLGASLLITILTQFISTALNLRGNHLSRALRDLLQTLYPEQAGHAEKITREILQHPLLSDSAFGSGDERDVKTAYRLPSAIGAAAVCGVAIGCMFDAPEYMVGAGTFAAVIGGLLIYFLSRNWELASAVRVEEFFGMLEKLGKSGPKTDLSQAMAQISQKIRQSGGLEQRLAELEELAVKCQKGITEVGADLRRAASDPAALELVDGLLGRIGGSAEREARIAKLRGIVNQNLHVLVDRLDELALAEITIDADKASLMTKIQAAAENGLGDLATLFNAAMDRASSRFALHSRAWTVTFSVAFAFLVHLDAIRLFKQLSSDAELRAKLVASSDAMMKQADQILVARPTPSSVAPAPSSVAPEVPPPSSASPGASGTPPPAPSPPPVAAPGVSPAVSASAACLASENLKGRVPDIYAAAMICPKTVVPFLAVRAAALATPGNDKATGAWRAAKKEIGPFATREDALDFLEKRLSGLPEHDQAIEKYRENLSQLLQGSDTNQLFDHAASINGQLARAGIELLPDPYPGIWPSRKELPGLLVAAALLSLGAPFWFNALKTLSNLRPLVATREEKDRQDRAKAKQPSREPANVA